MKSPGILKLAAAILCASPIVGQAAITNLVFDRVAGGGVARQGGPSPEPVSDFASDPGQSEGTLSAEAFLSFGQDGNPLLPSSQIRHVGSTTFSQSGNTLTFSGNNVLTSAGNTGTTAYNWHAGSSTAFLGSQPDVWVPGTGDRITFDVTEPVQVSITGTASVLARSSPVGFTSGNIRIELTDENFDQLLFEQFDDLFIDDTQATNSIVNLGATLAPGTYILDLTSFLEIADSFGPFPGLSYTAIHSIEVSFTPIPEPGSAMLSLGLMMSGLLRRRR